MRPRALTLSLLCVVASVGAEVRAQDNSATVEALFGEGKRLMTEGKVAEACPKFLASYNLEARVGTLLNLADCYEKNGQLASAWARFVEARTLASRAGQKERVDFANEHATALEPKLSRLTIVLKEPAPEEVVKRDGVVVEPGAFGVAVAVDSGTIEIEASAPGKKSWTGSVIVGPDADRKSIEVPALADAPRVETPKAARSGEARGGLSGRGVVGLATAGVGVIGVGIGAAFGVVALGKNSDSNAYCGQNGNGKNDCFDEGYALRNDAVSAGNLSTIFMAAGAALVIGGLVVWLTAPRSSRQAASLIPATVTF